MGVRNKDKELLDRLGSKTLKQQFQTEICQGLSCSPFEANAVYDVVEEVFFPLLDEHQPDMPPGRISLVVVDADEPAGKPVAECRKQNVCLHPHRGNEDDQLMLKSSPAAFRQARIPELCQEALSQGGLLTCEDLAFRIFFVTTRTISRDLQEIRKSTSDSVIPLRGTRHDIGPVLTHRVQVVRLALEGKTTSQICRSLHHSELAVGNYLGTFARVAQLYREQQMQAGQIAFLLNRGVGLVHKYIDLVIGCEQDQNHAYHLEELMRKGRCGDPQKNGEVS